jgi:hypothetical protein
MIEINSKYVLNVIISFVNNSLTPSLCFKIRNPFYVKGARRIECF